MILASYSLLGSFNCYEDGNIVANGTTQEVLTKDNLEKVFNIDVVLDEDPRTGKPLLVTYDLFSKTYS